MEELRHLWALPLGTTYGRYLWVLPLGATSGRYPWALHMGTTCGCYLRGTCCEVPRRRDACQVTRGYRRQRCERGGLQPAGGGVLAGARGKGRCRATWPGVEG